LRPRRAGSPIEVLRAFLRLGLTSFGGQVAHLGYFRIALFVQRRWFDEPSYADLLALCQLSPAPASSRSGSRSAARTDGGLMSAPDETIYSLN